LAGGVSSLSCFLGIEKIKIILDNLELIWDNRTIMLKVMFWSIVAFCGLCHWVGSGHEGWGLIIFLVLYPIVLLRLFLTIGKGAFNFVKDFFSTMTSIF